MVESLSQLQAIEWQVVDLLPVLRKHRFGHLHWRKREGFDPREEYNRWLFSQGREYPFNDRDPKEASLEDRGREVRSMEEYFAYFGVRINLMNNFAGGNFYNRENAFNFAIRSRDVTRYSPEGIVALFHEVDFDLGVKLKFKFSGDAEPSLYRIVTAANCTRISGAQYVVEDFALYVPKSPFYRSLDELEELIKQGRLAFLGFDPEGRELVETLSAARVDTAKLV